MKYLVLVLALFMSAGVGMVIAWGMVRYWAAEEARKDKED